MAYPYGEEELRRIAELWRDPDKLINDIREEVGGSRDQLSAAAHEMGLGRKPVSGDRCGLGCGVRVLMREWEISERYGGASYGAPIGAGVT